MIETVGATKIDSLKTLEDVEDESRKYLHFLLNYYNATNVELYYLHYVYNKDKKNVVVDNVVKPTMYVNNTTTQPNDLYDLYDIVEIILEPIIIHKIKYLYNPTNNKVYSSEYKYLGRYNSKEEVLCSDFPDSDSEPF